jgi:hypothetical protein
MNTAALLVSLAIVICAIIIIALVLYNIGWSDFKFVDEFDSKKSIVSDPTEECPLPKKQPDLKKAKGPSAPTKLVKKLCCTPNKTLSRGKCYTPCILNSDCEGEAICKNNLQNGICISKYTPSWTANGENKNITNLRFRSCIFTLTSPKEETYSIDVTSILNNMASAYNSTELMREDYVIPKVLFLDYPISPLSFSTDVITITTKDLSKWKASLTGKYRTN